MRPNLTFEIWNKIKYFIQLYILLWCSNEYELIKDKNKLNESRRKKGVNKCNSNPKADCYLYKTNYSKIYLF